MNRDAKAANAGGTFYIKKGDEVAFDDSKFKAGDEVASIIINPLPAPTGATCARPTPMPTACTPRW